MTAKEIREKYLKFFESKGHKVIPSASLIPENDPTVLFTTAGMHPLVPYLLGEKHPEGSRLCNVQKCVRTNDIDEVGDAWHLTFFEMLGNWSLGDYFKKEAIEWSFEFLTSKNWLGIDPNRLSVSVFVSPPKADDLETGDQDAPKDTAAAEGAGSADIWKKVGIPGKRIYYYPKSENWWGPAGETGPCGPDTEIFFDTLKSPWKRPHKCEPKCECGRYAEIWNLVFMEYNKKVKSMPRTKTQFLVRGEKLKVKSYKYAPLRQRNIDTGMGLERMVAVLNGKGNIYDTDLFEPIISKIKELIPNKPKVPKVQDKLSPEQIKSVRIIADHLRAATFILADGVTPSNLDRGYVLRRLIRRAVRHAKLLNMREEKNLSQEVARVVINIMQKQYPELSKNQEKILEELQKEEEKFGRTLERGLKELDNLFPIGAIEEIKNAKLKAYNRVDAKKAFYIYQSFGFPLEMIQEELGRRALFVDPEEFQREFQKHQEISRKGAEKKFKGGLADASEATIKYHTATHLLQAALREVLGKHVEQRGSNITPERLRFDFSHPEKMTAGQIQKVEEIVNQKIQEKLPVICEEMSPEEAKHQGAIGLFGHKYGDRVKVYSINSFSKEICGGPHTKNTGELGRFQIIKEESSSAGVRRIKASLT